MSSENYEYVMSSTVIFFGDRFAKGAMIHRLRTAALAASEPWLYGIHKEYFARQLVLEYEDHSSASPLMLLSSESSFLEVRAFHVSLSFTTPFPMSQCRVPGFSLRAFISLTIASALSVDFKLIVSFSSLNYVFFHDVSALSLWT